MFFEKLLGNTNKLLSFLVLIIVFFVPIWVRIALLLIPLLVLVWILSKKWKNVIPAVRKNRFAQILILFWILHLIGVFYSTNWRYGLQDVQQKLSFLLFPIIFVTFSNDEEYDVNMVIKTFLYGSIISGIICFFNAFYNSISLVSGHFIFCSVPQDALWDNYFVYTRLAFLNHPSYISMYFSFSIAILFKLIKDSKGGPFQLFSYISLIIYFGSLIILLSSRAGILTLILTIIAGVIWLFTNRIGWILKVGILGILGTFIIVLFFSLNKKSPLIKELKENVLNNLNLGKSHFSNAYDMRFYLWQCIPSVMSNNLVFGHGTGDFKIALNKEYNKRNLVNAYKNEYNAHNQFLESLVSLGLVGLIIMLMLIAYPVYYLLRKGNNYLSILFILIIVVNFLAESMLSRIAGILFFALFYSLFFCLKKI